MRDSARPTRSWRLPVGLTLLAVALLLQACGSGGGSTAASGSAQVTLSLRGVKGLTAGEAVSGLPPGCTGEITVTPPGVTVPITGPVVSVTVPAGVPVTIRGTVTCGNETTVAEATGVFGPGQTGNVTLEFSGVLPVLRVRVVGDGSVSGPGGFGCSGGTCQKSYLPGEAVKLTASPSSGVFSGACSGTGSCTVTMNGDKSVTVNFVPGTGTVVITNSHLYYPEELTFTGPQAIASVSVPAGGSIQISGLTPGSYVATGCGTYPFTIVAGGTTAITVDPSDCL